MEAKDIPNLIFDEAPMRCRLRQVGEMSVEASGEFKDRRAKLSCLQAGRTRKARRNSPENGFLLDTLFFGVCSGKDTGKKKREM